MHSHEGMTDLSAIVDAKDDQCCLGQSTHCSQGWYFQMQIKHLWIISTPVQGGRNSLIIFSTCSNMNILWNYYINLFKDFYYTLIFIFLLLLTMSFSVTYSLFGILVCQFFTFKEKLWNFSLPHFYLIRTFFIFSCFQEIATFTVIL